ncbi:MAG: hypothetical protein JNK97_02645 [Zoogloea sp.]|nr:hypothetical protein [Zoogloea sp.]
MKIAAASMDLAATHRASSTVDVEERLRAWIGPRPGSGEARPPSRAVVVSDAARQALNLEKAAPAAPVATDEVEADPQLELLRSIVEMLTGQRIHLMSASDMNPDQVAAEAARSVGAATEQEPEFGVEYDRTETRTHSEETRFAAEGRIRTADGREIGFSVALSMSRSETETRELSLRAGNAVSKDPLVVNFSGSAASLSSQRFSFDLMGDGREVAMPVLQRGSGFLVLDAREGAQVTSGRQLFGPASGDGFADLARHDSDANGWIDEADPVFSRLGVWTPDAQGGGEVVSLGEARIGALYLGRVATPFTLKEGGEDLGAVRSSGIYAREDGGVGTLQQVDLKV